MNERFFNHMILHFLDDLRGIPQKREEVSNHVRNRVRMPCEAQVNRALAFLESSKYIRPAGTAADDDLWVITDDGTRQIKRMVPRADLDPMIWEN